MPPKGICASRIQDSGRAEQFFDLGIDDGIVVLEIRADIPFPEDRPDTVRLIRPDGEILRVVRKFFLKGLYDIVVVEVKNGSRFGPEDGMSVAVDFHEKSSPLQPHTQRVLT